MSNARKLQTEIERCMKKVDEGVELFDEIWEKVYSAEQQNQKEKYEMDLKKEIKKLQRQRDQIKTWISSSEVKDKDPLIEARKLIESKMEQFKICEKETKTKTYSKEGLAREDKLDPEEEAKLNTTTWLGEYIDKFNAELEEKDFEIERLSSGKGKKSHKSQLEALQQHVANHKFHISKLEGIIRLVNNDRLDVEVVDPLKEDLDYYLESYQDEDYAQAYDEDYFYESLGLDDLDIVNVDRVTNNVSSSSLAGSFANNSSMNGSKKSDDATSTSSRGSKDTKKSGKKSSMSSVIPLTIGRARSKQEKTAEKAAKAQQQSQPQLQSSGSGSGSDHVHNDDRTTSSSNTVPTGTATTLGSTSAPSGATPSKMTRSGSSGNNSNTVGSKTVLAPPTASAAQQPGTSMAAILKRETEQQEKERQQKMREQAKAQAAQLAADQLRQQQQQQQVQLAAQQRQQQEAMRQQEAIRLKQQQQQAQALRQQQQQDSKMRQHEDSSASAAALSQDQQQHSAEQIAATSSQQQHTQSQTTQQQPMAQQNLRAPAPMTADSGDSSGQGQALGSSASFVGNQTGMSAANQNQVLGQKSNLNNSSNNSAVGILTSGLGGLGLGGAGSASVRPVNDSSVASAPSSAVGGVSAVENSRLAAASTGPSSSYVSSALNDSFVAVPHTIDHDRGTQYVPQNPYHSTPPSYPTTPSPILDKPEIFEKLGTDALFFVFYYAQGSYQQYLAARELKKQSWRFHKKYMTWFQRHEEPQITTDEYEQGTYVYFDYETGWCTRIKTDFRFEYSYLEDSLQ